MPYVYRANWKDTNKNRHRERGATQEGVMLQTEISTQVPERVAAPRENCGKRRSTIHRLLRLLLMLSKGALLLFGSAIAVTVHVNPDPTELGHIESESNALVVHSIEAACSMFQ